jgi:hypothetical protein
MAFWSRWFGRKREPQRIYPPQAHQILASLPDTEQGRAIAEQMRFAEVAYDEMYEGRSASGPYSEMKACLGEAIRLAREAQLPETASELERLLDHRRDVFHHQMR